MIIDSFSRIDGVSVIVPVFNREEFLGECIESILSQDYTGLIEIIISDDGSIDKSLEIAHSYGNRVKVVAKPIGCISQGASGARNRGIAVSKCRYIAFLDSDDYFLPGYLQRMVNELKENEDIGYAYCRCKKESVDSNGIVTISDWTRKKLSRLDQEYHVLSRAFCINTNVIVFRAEVFNAVGVFNTELTNGEDTDLWLRVSEIYKGIFVDIFGSVYRVNHGNSQLTSANVARMKECSAEIYTAAFSRAYASINCDPLRMLLIVRALLYGTYAMSGGRIGSIYRHSAVTLKLLVLFPVATVKFIKLHFA